MSKIEELGRRLKEAREKTNLKPVDAARIADVSLHQISGWEGGKVLPDVFRLAKLAELYGTTVDDLVRGL